MYITIAISPFGINWPLINTINVLGSYISNRNNRGLINGKAPKTTALCYFSDMLSLSQSGGEGASYPQTLTLPHLRCFMITPLNGNRKQNTNNVYQLTFSAEIFFATIGYKFLVLRIFELHNKFLCKTRKDHVIECSMLQIVTQWACFIYKVSFVRGHLISEWLFDQKTNSKIW